MSRLHLWFIALVLTLALAPAAQAQNDAAKAEMENAFKDARASKVEGPSDVKLLDQGTLKLPAGFTFVPVPAAERLMRAMGNGKGEGMIGLIFPGEYPDSLVVLRYIKSGYIKDDDARDWKSDEMFDSLKSGTEAGNAERKSRGIPEMEVVAWVERPAYDDKAHRLIWSISTRDKGVSGAAGQGVNYNTYALGREGYVSMNLVTDLKAVEAQKPMAKQLLAAMEFDSGKRYADFNSSTDKVAEYGLAALVGGLAAKKLGLFAIIGAFILKFIKVFAVAGIALLAGFAKFFGKKKPEPEPMTSPKDTVFATPGASEGFGADKPAPDPFPPTRPLAADPFPATRPLESMPDAPPPPAKPPGT